MPARLGRKLLTEAKRFGGVGIAVFEQIEATRVLVGFTDRLRGLGQDCDATQETTVRFMAVGHGTETLPTVATQLVESAVVSGTRVA